ncbi:patatin-like protein [Streptomyces sp. NPDC086549]|uniref:patatin-like protein n=1 Tax=Streptomyces sp. NPDC086549 TaxID=3365752 RepID=UPI0037F898F7
MGSTSMGSTSRLGPGTLELRIATAMTGGVSLAVWMGGVARELNLLQQAAWWRNALPEDAPLPDPAATAGGDERARVLYLRLLDLLDTTVSVDVLSGTSAGGINAALLGLARARSWDLGPLRDFWLKSGAFETLLRDPTQKKPPSLLQGDGVLFQDLVHGIDELDVAARSIPKPSGTVAHDVTGQTQVFITTTLLTGETGRFTDSYGTQVQDEDHRGLFVFDEDSLRSGTGALAVALAARSSASFPCAFEPSFLPYGNPVAGRPGAPGRPAMKRYANITRPHWAADGGLLANRPIRPLLRAVFDRPAVRQVRRVLLYVVPTAGGAPDPRAMPDQESFEQPWTLGEALMKDLGAALSQSISAELTELRDHNDRMDALRDTRRRMAELGSQGRKAVAALAGHMRATGARPPAFELLTEPMRDDFRTREAAWLARPVITSLMRTLTTRPPEAMARDWLDALAPGRSAEEECRAAAVDEVTKEWRFPAPGERGAVLYGRLAAFGVAPFLGAKATVRTMLRAAYVCRPEQRRELADVVLLVHQAYEPGRPPDVECLAETALNDGLAERRPLTDVAAEAMKVYWGRRNTPAPSDPGADARPRPGLKDGWARLAAAVVKLRAVLPESVLAPPADDAPSPAPPTTSEGRRQKAAAELRTYFEFLPEDTDGIALALFELHVATRSVLPVGTEVEQPIELVQVSADTRCLLAPRRATAASKLTGLQLHHFGAFYKSSWRANDWTWGRLDGAGWLVHLVLDPRRVLTVAQDAPVDGSRRAWFYERLRDLFAHGTDPDDFVDVRADGTDIRLTREAVFDELSFLDDPTAPMPPSLPLTSMWVAKAWQRCVAEVELPVIAREMMSTPSARPHVWAARVLDAAGSPARAQAAARTAVAAVMDGNWTAEQRRLIESERQAADAERSAADADADADAERSAADADADAEGSAADAARRAPDAAHRTANPGRQTVDPAQPADPAPQTAAPARHATDPVHHPADPAHHATDPARPADGSQQQVAAPGQQSGTRAQRTGGPTRPVGAPAHPTGEPAQPVDAPAHPTGGSAQPVGTQAHPTSRSPLTAGAGVTAANPDALAALLATCPVPDETFAGELGEPLLTRTAGKAAAVAASAVSGFPRIPAPLKPFLASARTVTLAGHRVSALTRGRARTLILTGLAALAVGVLSMIQRATWLGLTGTVLALIGGYLLALGTYAHWRRVLVAAGAFTAVVAVFFLGCPVGRRVLFGTGGRDIGVVGRDVLPWLRAPWWHPLVALGAIAVLAVLFSGLLTAAWQSVRHRTGRPKSRATPRTDAG